MKRKPRNGPRRPKDGRWKRPYTELTYQPMQEVLSYLRANGFKTYIVTGGGQDFVRVYSEQPPWFDPAIFFDQLPRS